MKTLGLILFVMFLNSTQGQTIDHILFDYDAAGNQIKRYVIDIIPGKPSDQDVKSVEDLIASDLIETDIYNDVKYYPNPVKEELYVQWTNLSGIYVTHIELYSLAGQSLKNFPNLNGIDNISVSFNSYPEGFYNLVLVYSSGERKSLKIVKR